MNQHPDASLTLRQAFEKHYDKSDLAPASLKMHHFALKAWERLTDNPPVGEIDNAVVAAFRQAAVESGYVARTVNSFWGRLRAILRRLGPPVTGNPWGLEIIPRVPAMKPVRQTVARPKMVPLDDISRVYVAARNVESPRTGVPPADWWRCLLVMALTTGLRRCDLFALRWNQLDLQHGTMDFRARKTGKADLWPLHPVAVAHLERIRRPDDGRVFRGCYNGGTSGLYGPLHWLLEQADVPRFGLHDLRRTGASLIEQVAPGLGPEFLQHAPRGVSDVSYLNRFDSLKAALDKMPLPDGFRAGPKMSARHEERERAKRIEFSHSAFIVPTGPNPADWDFRYGQFAYRGQWHPLPSAMRLAVLRELATSTEPVPRERLIEVAKAANSASRMANPHTISVVIAALRDRVRHVAGLRPDADPVPCVQKCPPAWTLWIPPA